MPRIPDEQLARIKREVSLLALVKSQGYKLVKQGTDFAVHCPYSTALAVEPRAQ